MATLKYFAFSFCILFIGMGSLRSQTITSKDLDLRAYRTRQILEAIKEKMHLPKGVVSGMRNDEESTLSVTIDSNEKISTSYPESEVHAAMNPTDTANIVLGPIHLDNGMTLPIYYTTNFGVKWNKSTFQPQPYDPNAQISGGGDPVFAFDASGTVYMSWIDTYGSFTEIPGDFVDSVLYGMYWAYSTNMGKSWQRTTNGYIGTGQEVILIDSATGAETLASNTGFDDKEWIAVDRSNSPYSNSLYVAWTHLGTTSSNVMVRRKIPGVDSMQPAVKASSDDFAAVQYTSLGIDAKGGLHVTFLGTYDTSNYGMYTVYSSDGGATFGPAVKISDADIPTRSADAISDGYTIYGIRQQGNYPCAHLSIDTSGTGNLYEVWCAIGVEADSELGSEIYFSRSTNNGATWSNPSIINNDLDTEMGQIDHFYPSIAVNAKGTISVTWYDRREDQINNTVGRYYIGQSTDQGQTWTNGPVAVAPMNFSNVMLVNQNFGIGEYTQVLTTPNYVIPIWSDGRDNEGELRVYAAFLYSSPLVSTAALTASASVERLSSVSEGLELSDNYPNPFSSTTSVSFTLETPAHAELYVTNITGQRIASIYNGMAEAGEHDFTFDGSQLANGVYYLNLESDLGIVRQAMTILR
jgi:hypothetical protein